MKKQILISAMCLMVCLQNIGQARIVQNSPTQELDSRPVTAATVDSFEISVGAAEQLIKQSLPNLQNAADNPLLLQAAVKRLVDRRVVYKFLESRNHGASEDAVRMDLEQLKETLAKTEQTIESLANKTKQFPAEIEFEIAWRIAWQQTMEAKLTDAYLESHFEMNRRRFDDSEMRVAHILFKLNKPDGKEVGLAKAERVRSAIVAGTLTWEEAVKVESNAPTKDSNGDLGWITFTRPMPRVFSVAAFELKEGEISPPISTAFGIHLIKCLEIREGKTGWRDAIDKVREHATSSLFSETADRYRDKLKIEFVK